MLANISEPVFLLSPWKPVLMWLPFLAWAWLLGQKIDEDARRAQLNSIQWNLILLISGIVGLAVMLVGWKFYISWFAGLAIMLAPILVYWKVRNAAVDINQRYYLKFSKDPDKAAGRRLRKQARSASLTFTGPDGQIPVPDKDDPTLPTYVQLEAQLLPAIEAGAARVDLALGSGGLISGMMLDTVRTKNEPLNPEDGMLVVNMLKSFAGLDQAETRRTQYGSFQVSGDEGFHTVTVIASGSSRGQVLRLDFDQKQRIRLPFTGLGLTPTQQTLLEELIPEHNRRGVVLLSSPAGQGLTTTAYAIVGSHDAYTSNIKTLERRVLTRLEGVDHVEWDASNPDIDYATSLQSILRRDPDIVLAELLDSDTANVAANAGRNGPLQYMMLPADSAAVAIREWVRLVGDVPKAAAPLRAVVCQRLVRVLCPDCKQAVTPADPASLRLPEGTTIHQAGGKIQVRNRVEDCPTCSARGYLGVTGLFEVFPIDDECRGILEGGDLKAAMAQIRRRKTLMLQEVGLRRVVEGVTSLDEVSRVLKGGKQSPGASKAQAKAS